MKLFNEPAGKCLSFVPNTSLLFWPDNFVYFTWRLAMETSVDCMSSSTFKQLVFSFPFFIRGTNTSVWWWHSLIGCTDSLQMFLINSFQSWGSSPEIEKICLYFLYKYIIYWNVVWTTQVHIHVLTRKIIKQRYNFHRSYQRFLGLKQSEMTQ